MADSVEPSESDLGQSLSLVLYPEEGCLPLFRPVEERSRIEDDPLGLCALRVAFALRLPGGGGLGRSLRSFAAAPAEGESAIKRWVCEGGIGNDPPVVTEPPSPTVRWIGGQVSSAGMR
jgi:hypothetical protein